MSHAPEWLTPGWRSGPTTEAVNPGSDLAAAGYVPCVRHGPGMPHPENKWACFQCVAEGIITLDNPTAPPPPKPTREVELEQAVQSKLEAELAVERLRRERIDFAIERGDVSAVAQLGGGERAIQEAEAIARQNAGTDAPSRVHAEAQAPVRGLPVVEGRVETTERTGADVGVVGILARPSTTAATRTLDEERVAALSSLADAAADESFRAVGVHWP